MEIWKILWVGVFFSSEHSVESSYTKKEIMRDIANYEEKNLWNRYVISQEWKTEGVWRQVIHARQAEMNEGKKSTVN